MSRLIDLRLIQLEKPIEYLNNKSILYPSLIYEFTGLSEEQMASFKFPGYVSEQRKRILNSRYGKDSYDYKDFYTATTAITILIRCARINQAIHDLCSQYRRKLSYNTYSLESYFPSNCEKAIYLKNTIVELRDWLNCYNKKYTVDDFENDFISHINFGVRSLCYTLLIDTESPMKLKAERAINNSLGCMVFFIFFLVSASLFAMIASSI